MKFIFTIAFCLAIMFDLAAQEGLAIVWQRAIGGTAFDIGHETTFTSDGGSIFVGATSSTDGDLTGPIPGYISLWVVKLDQDGEIQWQRTMGGSMMEMGFGISETSDGGFIISGMATSTDGDLIGANPNGAWIIKLGTTGVTEWSTVVASTEQSTGSIIKQLPDQNYVVVFGLGLVNGFETYQSAVHKLDPQGNVLWSTIMETDILLGSVTPQENELIITGLSVDDAYIAKLDAGGNILWETTVGGSGSEHLGTSVVLDNGNILAVGETSSDDGDVTGNYGGRDIWLVEFSTAGELLGEWNFGGSGDDGAFALAPYGADAFLIFGSTNSTNGDITTPLGGIDEWLLCVNGIGDLLWQKTFGGSNDDAGYFMDVSPVGEVILSGVTNSSNGDVTNFHGEQDAWVLKLTAEFNTMLGNVFGDMNADGIQNAEPGVGHHLMIETTTGRLAFTDSQGNFDLRVIEPGTFVIQPSPLEHYTSNPESYQVAFGSLNETSPGNDFALQPSGVVNDLKVTITPLGAFRPGFNAYYDVHFRNSGSTTISSTLVVQPDELLSFLGASIDPGQIVPGQMTWALGDLPPFAEGHILLTFNVDLVAQLGDTTSTSAGIEPIADDLVPENNHSLGPMIVTGSYDPNDIQVDKAMIDIDDVASQPWLEYLIRFQNTGTDTAFTVDVKNVLPQNLDLTSLQFLGSSHGVEIEHDATNNWLWFRHSNILLPDSNTNETLSHGYLRYRVRPSTDLVLGEQIAQQAEIYFDFNAPIITNTAITTVVEALTIQEESLNMEISLYPNPTTGDISLDLKLDQWVSVTIDLFSSTGQLMKSVWDGELGDGNKTFQLTDLPSGIHHLHVTINGRTIVRKVVKM